MKRRARGGRSITVAVQAAAGVVVTDGNGRGIARTRWWAVIAPLVLACGSSAARPHGDGVAAPRPEESSGPSSAAGSSEPAAAPVDAGGDPAMIPTRADGASASVGMPAPALRVDASAGSPTDAREDASSPDAAPAGAATPPPIAGDQRVWWDGETPATSSLRILARHFDQDSTPSVTATTGHSGTHAIQIDINGTRDFAIGDLILTPGVQAPLDVSGFVRAVVWVKVEGTIPRDGKGTPCEFCLTLRSNASEAAAGFSSKPCLHASDVPDMGDGQWHRVTIPFAPTSGTWNPKNVLGIEYMSLNRTAKYRVYLDDIALERGP
jgi:hypothetical protein